MKYDGDLIKEQTSAELADLQREGWDVYAILDGRAPRIRFRSRTPRSRRSGLRASAPPGRS